MRVVLGKGALVDLADLVEKPFRSFEVAEGVHCSGEVQPGRLQVPVIARQGALLESTDGSIGSMGGL